MTLDVGTKTIGEIYYGDYAISEVWKGDDLVWSAYAPDVNFIFRDIDDNGVLGSATGSLESASEITKIGNYGLAFAFYYQPIVGEVNLSNVVSVRDYGLYNAFYANSTSPNGITSVRLDNLKSVGTSALDHTFCYNSSLTNVNVSTIETISSSYAFRYAFEDCTNLSMIDFSNLTQIIGCQRVFEYTFFNCSNLETISFPKLKQLATQCFKNAFTNCSKLKNITFPKLEFVDEEGLYETFSSCVSLENITFPKLYQLGKNSFRRTFRYCTGLKNIYFPSLENSTFSGGQSNDPFGYTTSRYYMLTDVTGCTVHFPNNLQNIIGNWVSVTNGFGGTNTTILFDLPSTN